MSFKLTPGFILTSPFSFRAVLCGNLALLACLGKLFLAKLFKLLYNRLYRRARHAGHCWRSKDELVSDVLLWTPTYGQAKAGRPARTYIQQLCEDTGCNPEDLP